MKEKVIIYLLFVLGFTLLFYGPIKNSVITLKKETVSRAYKETAQVSKTPNMKIAEPSLGNVLKIKKTSTYMGIITVDRIGLQEFVSPDFTDQSLLTGTVNMFPKRHPEKDNLVIVGHHIGEEGLLFGRLPAVKKDDLVRLVLGGYEYRYRITNKFITTEENIAVMDSHDNHPQLTLITCDKPTYTEKRLIVQGELVMDKRSTELKKIQKITSKQQQLTFKRMINYLPLIILLAIYGGLFLIIFKWRVK